MPAFPDALFSRVKGEVVEGRTGRRLGGKELRSAVVACAARLAQCADGSARPGPVVLVLDLALDSVVAYLGGLLSGRTVIPVEAKEWGKKSTELIQCARPVACWFPDKMSAAAHACPPEIQTQCGLPEVPPARDFRPDLDEKLVGRARLLALTSGSTGKPAMVCVADANLLANTQDIVLTQGLGSVDRALLTLPLSYCFGASVLHSHLWAGASVVVDDRLMFPEKVLDTLEAEVCSTFAGVPTSFLFLSSHSTVLRRRFSGLRRWLQAGGYLSADVVHCFRAAHPDTDFFIMYGQTEATSRIATFRVDGIYPHGCVGFPMPSLEIQIRAESGELVGLGGEGVIWARGESVCPGYYANTERDTGKFVDGWLNTGDIGHMLADGRLCITGRSGGFIKIRGRRVSSLEVEDVVWRSLAMRSCACAIPDQTSGEVIGLYIHRGDGNQGHADEELTEQLRRIFPQHWDLGPVVFGELPFTSSGKINRHQSFGLLKKALGGTE